jgi:outer membrane protein OmpA-like peptidoglycan-associated protein
MQKVSILLTSFFLLLSGSWASVYRVPQDKRSINDALEMSEYGDTVIVSPGRYRENVTLIHGVVLKGMGPKQVQSTILDGVRRGPTVYAVTGSEICYFTITNGIDGILCENANVNIHHNWIIDNHGAGIGAFITLPTIYNNVIYGNRWSGILAWGAKSLDTRIDHNVVVRNGYSGITLKGPCRVVIRSNIITGNHEYGIYSDPASGQSQITYNNIYKNVIPFNRYCKINRTNISFDPLFISPSLFGTPNYFIASKSPLRKKGYGRVDIGLLAKDVVVQVDEDTDGDGVADSKDVCPYIAEDIDGFDDADGCPDFDNDGDGISDANDACPSIGEDKDGFEDDDGCPEEDNDKDGIPDKQDKCPDRAETVNSFKDEDGCPDKKPTKVEDQFTLEGVNFRTGSAEILEESYSVLDDVYDMLEQFPETRFEISGHTDNRGSDDINMKLSLDRANSIRNYLVNRGVSPGRLTAKGYGETRPKATNNTAEGRSENRRIEFYRLK